MENLGTWGDSIRGKGVEFLEFSNQSDVSLINSWEPVVKMMRGSDATSNFSGKTGAGYPQRTADGSPVATGNRYKLYDTSVSQDPISLRLEITRQTLLYRRHGEAFNENNDLIRAYKNYLTRGAAQFFTRAFTSGAGVSNGTRIVPYGDGAPLCSTSHPRVDGGTAQSNASATGIPLTEANFETGRIALYNQLQDDGVPITAPGELWLVVGINNDKQAQIIAKSEKRAGTGNNDLNIYLGLVNVLSTTYLDTVAGATNNTHWFIVAANYAKLTMIISAGPDIEILQDKNTKSHLFDLMFDAGFCAYDWRGVWGTLGDNAAYAS